MEVTPSEGLTGVGEKIRENPQSQQIFII